MRHSSEYVCIACHKQLNSIFPFHAKMQQYPTTELNVQLKSETAVWVRGERKRTAIRAIWKLYQALCSGSGCYSFIDVFVLFVLVLFFSRPYYNLYCVAILFGENAWNHCCWWWCLNAILFYCFNAPFQRHYHSRNLFFMLIFAAIFTPFSVPHHPLHSYIWRANYFRFVFGGTDKKTTISLKFL